MERKGKWIRNGWLYAIAAVAVVLVLTFSGGARNEAQASSKQTAAPEISSSAERAFAKARAETDVLDLQLD